MVASPQTAARRAVHSEPREAPIRPSGPVSSGQTIQSLRDFVRRSPAVLEAGLTPLDTALRAGEQGEIDCLAADRDGALTIVVVASDAETGLVRLLDQYLWASEQRALLARAYPDAAGASDRPIRCFLVAPSFRFPFLRRLTLLGLSIELRVARPIPATEPLQYLVEPASEIYGEVAGGLALTAESGVPEASWTMPVELGPEIPLPPVAEDDPILRDLGLHPGVVVDPDPGVRETVEALTAEEFEEFERFDRQRRVRDGAP